MAEAARATRSTASAPVQTATRAPAITSSVPAVSPLLSIGPPAVRLGNTPSAGAPMPLAMQTVLSRGLGADLNAVRVHTDPQAATAAQGLSARAFTIGNHIFLGAGERPTDLGLMAHETTHVIQQQGAPRLQRWSLGSGDHYEHEAQRAASAVQQGSSFNVQQRTTGLSVQRIGIGGVLDGLARLAANVPGFTLLTLIIGRNPINMREVERSAVNVLRAFMGLIPGGEIFFQVLNQYGIVQRIGDWVNQQTLTMGLTLENIRAAFTRFTDSLGFSDIFSPGDVWERAKNIFAPTITRITAFVGGLISQAITWLKETFMQPLSNFCREIPGYGLVTVLLGRDPFTNVAVPRSAINVVRAFAEFIPGGTEKVNQLVESRALERAYQWFTDETQARNLTWARVTGTFAQAWNALHLEDVLHPIDTLQRMITLFRPLMGDLISFAGAALMKLLELIFEAVMGAGGARILSILKRARATFLVIINNPVGFLRNLLGAVGQGVRQFMTNILRHLREGVIAWLTGPVAAAGVQMPAQWDLRGIIGFVLQILGLTWARVRQKLVNLMGKQAVEMLEAGFQLILDIRDRGLVPALRDRVTEFFGSLREAALGAIRSFIQQRLVQAGITQLLSLLSPVGAVIQAILKTYTTIKFFIDKINQILDLVESVVNSISAIASGAIGAAANFVEHTMARTIPVILDFLARFIGLGDVGAQVQTTIRNLQASVDGMLNRAVEWIRNQARNLASRALGGDPNVTPQQRLQNGLREGTQAINRLSGNRVGLALIRPVLTAIRLRHNMQRLDAEPRSDRWVVVGTVNPTGSEGTDKLVDSTTAGATAPPVSVGTPIVHTLRSGYKVATRVAALNVAMTVTGQTQTGTRLEWQNAWVPNSRFGSGQLHVWDAPPMPPFVGFASGPPRITIVKTHLNSGTSASGSPPGWDSTGKWRYRGHLVPRVLGGPGGTGSGNIVAMTHLANAVASGGMPGIELPLRDDIHQGAIYNIRVLTDYDTSVQVPPIRVRFFATRLYPDPQLPPTVPTANPYIVVNT